MVARVADQLGTGTMLDFDIAFLGLAGGGKAGHGVDASLLRAGLVTVRRLLLFDSSAARFVAPAVAVPIVAVAVFARRSGRRLPLVLRNGFAGQDDGLIARRRTVVASRIVRRPRFTRAILTVALFARAFFAWTFFARTIFAGTLFAWTVLAWLPRLANLARRMRLARLLARFRACLRHRRRRFATTSAATS